MADQDDGWVRCSERLPEHGDIVLGFDGEDVWQCQFANGLFWAASTTLPGEFDATYWRPLPPPPSEEGER